MSDGGLEHPSLMASKTPISEGGGAESDARRAPEAPKDPELAEIVAVWPGLPGHIKAAIKALVGTYAKTKTEE